MRTFERPVESFLITILLAAALPAGAQTASLAADINTAPGQGERSSPRQLFTVGEKVFFADGEGAWASDGTPAGTLLLREQKGVSLIGPLGGTVFWTAAAGGPLPDLWRSDGTREGTFALTDSTRGLRLQAYYFGPPAALFKGRLWFTACETGAYSCSLWNTDGTPEGVVKDVEVGLGGAYDLNATASHLFFRTEIGQSIWATDGSPGTAARVARLPEAPGPLTVAGDRLFFTAPGGTLWASDGTASGTGPLASGVSGALVPAGGRVYFAVRTAADGPRNLWVSDGTAQGTRAVTQLAAGGAVMSSGGSLAAAGGRLVFVGLDASGAFRLFATDGRPESTVRLPDPTPCSGSGCPGLIGEGTSLVPVGERAVFLGTTPEGGSELWSTDGVQGARRVADLCPGLCDGASALLPSPLRAGGVLVQARAAASAPSQIWSSDGTPQGTKRLTGVPDGGVSLAFPHAVARRGTTLFFISTSLQGSIWATDGTPATTRLVYPGATSGSADPRELTPAAGGALFFTACDAAGGRRIWVTHGTEGGTAAIPGEAAAECPITTSEPMILGAVGGTAIFRPAPRSLELWRTDGTAAGTFLLVRPFAVAVGASAAAVAGRLVFAGFVPPFSSVSLWTTDGTVAGTGVLMNFPGSSSIPHLETLGGALYFTVTDSNGTAVWVSSGTAVGTWRLTPPGRLDDPGFAALGSLVYFRGPGGGLWRTDGTPGGTVLAKLFPSLRELTAYNGALCFATGNSQLDITSLYRTDGTAEGTMELVRFLPTPLPVADRYLIYPTGLTVFAGRLFFAAGDEEHGVELWVSDGTPAGTKRLRDLVPGPESSVPLDFTVAGDRLFFTAGDPLHGRELWQTDGTADGTRLVQDLQPMSGSSRPGSLTAFGGRLYFAADDGLTGRELWSLPLTAAPGCRPTASRLCLNGGRFQVEAAWTDFQGRQGSGQAVPLTADTGYFWFFDPANVETVVKVLDGRGVNGHYWTFYGALSNVRYDLTVTDTRTGAARRYSNPLGRLASIGDVQSFGPLGALPRPEPAGGPDLGGLDLVLAETRIDPAAALTPCQPGAAQLCLEGNRFTVTAAWHDFQGHQGNGTAVPLTADTGYFWFFDAANVEVVLKVLDGSAVNGHRWVFYGALSNVEYTLSVTDSATGKVKTYRNPSGRFASVADTTAF